MSFRTHGDFKWKYSTPARMRSIFVDKDTIPAYLAKSYYLLAFDLLDGNHNIPANSIIFSELRNAVSNLTQREKEFLTLRYGLKGQKPYTLNLIGLKYEVCKERVRQVVNKALRQLRADKEKFVIKYKLETLKAQKDELENLISYYQEMVDSSSQFPELTIDDLALSNRAYNALSKCGLTSYAKLATLSIFEIKAIKNIGDKTAKEIWYKLHKVKPM